jgi:hypothetical protein
VTVSKKALVPMACFVMGLLSLVLGLVLLVPQFAGFYWEEAAPLKGRLEVAGAGFQLLALLALVLGIIALVERAPARRLTIAGVVSSAAVAVLVVAAHLGSM